MAHIAGLVAAGVHPSPVGHAQIVTSTTHKTLRGPRSGLILCDAERQPAIDKTVFPGMQGGPHMHTIAAKAVCFKLAMTEEFRAYQRQVVANAQRLAKRMIERGYAVVSGGTDTHLFLLDLSPQELTGKKGQLWLEEAGITTNKNTVPFDKQSPFVTSGLRIGTPALTTRGMREAEMDQIAGWIADVLDARGDAGSIAKVRIGVRELTRRYPLYPELES